MRIASPLALPAFGTAVVTDPAICAAALGLAIAAAAAIETTVAVAAAITAIEARAIVLLRTGLRPRYKRGRRVIRGRLGFTSIRRSAAGDALAFHGGDGMIDAAIVCRRCGARCRRNVRRLAGLIVRGVIEPFNFFQEVADVQEGVAIESDFDEGRLHAGKHARHLAFVDAAD